MIATKKSTTSLSDIETMLLTTSIPCVSVIVSTSRLPAEKAFNHNAVKNALSRAKELLQQHFPDSVETLIQQIQVQLQEKINKKYGSKVKTSFTFKNGTITDEINSFATKVKADLIVVGIQGAGYLAERLIGSTAALLMRTAKQPLLTIGKNTRFVPPKTIALAYDYQPAKKNILEKLKTFAGIFKSIICIVHVAEDTSVLPNKQHERESKRVEKILGNKSTVFYYVEDDDLVLGLNTFLKKTKTEMVAMLPGDHNLLDRMFKEPYSKKMAFRTKVPLLTIHQ